MLEPQKKSGPPLIALGFTVLLVLISEWLVFEKGLDSPQALLAVMAGALIVILAMLGILLLIAGQDRAELLRHVWGTMAKDYDGILKMFWLRKK